MLHERRSIGNVRLGDSCISAFDIDKYCNHTMIILHVLHIRALVCTVTFLFIVLYLNVGETILQ